MHAGSLMAPGGGGLYMITNVSLFARLFVSCSGCCLSVRANQAQGTLHLQVPGFRHVLLRYHQLQSHTGRSVCLYGSLVELAVAA